MNGRIKTNVTQGKGLAHIGTVRIGIKKLNQAGKEYPVSLDYFHVDDSCKYKAKFAEIFGDKPNIIPIVFYSDDLDVSCKEEFTCWEKGRLYGSGDGETYRVWDGKEYIIVGSDSPLIKGHDFARQLTLRFIIPAIKGILGHWVFTSKGKNSTVPNIVAQFDFVRERTGGTIIGFPFDMVVKKAKGYNPGESKNFSVVDIVPNFTETAMDAVKQFMKIDGKSSKDLVDAIGMTLTAEKLKQLTGKPNSLPEAVIISETVKKDNVPTKTISVKSGDGLFRQE